MDKDQYWQQNSIFKNQKETFHVFFFIIKIGSLCLWCLCDLIKRAWEPANFEQSHIKYVLVLFQSLYCSSCRLFCISYLFFAYCFEHEPDRWFSPLNSFISNFAAFHSVLRGMVFLLFEAIRWRNIDVIWSRVDSCLFWNHSSSTYYILLFAFLYPFVFLLCIKK